MNQSNAIQRCPHCGSVCLSPSYDNSQNYKTYFFKPGALRLFRAFFGKHTTACWTCQDCGFQFPMDD